MANWTQEDLEQTLRERGWYKEQKPISHGIQYRLVDDTPVDFYFSKGRVVVGGKETPLKREAKEFFERCSVEAKVPASSSSPVAGLPVPQEDGVQSESVLPKRVFTRLLQKSEDPLLPGSSREQAPGKSVIPRHPRESGEEAGIHFNQRKSLDSRFRGNDGPGRLLARVGCPHWR